MEVVLFREWRELGVFVGRFRSHIGGVQELWDFKLSYMCDFFVSRLALRHCECECGEQVRSYKTYNVLFPAFPRTLAAFCEAWAVEYVSFRVIGLVEL